MKTVYSTVLPTSISDGIFWDLDGVTLVEEDTNCERAGHVNNDFVDLDAWYADACSDIFVDIYDYI